MKSYYLNLNKTPKKIYSGHLCLGGTNNSGDIISFSNYYMEINNSPYFTICGEFHFSRCNCEQWEDELIKIKMNGVNTIATYIFWNHHEEDEGIFLWENNYDIRKFVKLCASHDLFVILRIGPFCHGEARNGGLPDWLHGKPFEVRSNDTGYLYYVEKLYNEIGAQVSGLMYKDGGPVIGVQLENEYMSAASFWENTNHMIKEWTAAKSKDFETGKMHMKELKNLAVKAGMEVPVFTCTGWGSPVIEDEILPLYGDYAFWPWIFNNPKRKVHPPTHVYLYCDYHNENTKCHNYNPTHSRTKIPFACCEMGAGAQITYKYRFTVPPASVEAMTNMKVAGGSNFIGYYMFHGGSNPVGKHSFLNERSCPMISYDFMAPVGEFCQVRESYLRLKNLHYFLKDFENVFCCTETVLPEESENMVAEDIESLRFAARSYKDYGFLFLNNYQDHLEMKDKVDFNIRLEVKNEIITIPENGGLTLRKDVSCILPFNLDIEGFLLKYATLQLITFIEHNGENYYFFFIPEGMKGEYCFDLSGINEISCENSGIEKIDKKIFVYVDENSSVLSLTSDLKRKINIVTLTKQQSSSLWKAEVYGRERLLLSDAVVLASKEELKLETVYRDKIYLGIFPEIIMGLPLLGSEITNEKTKGIFTTYCIKLPKKEVIPEIEVLDESRAVLKFLPEDFVDVKELILKVDYTGDVGYAYIDGKLIHDNFSNGETWDIGLKKYEKEILNKGIYLYIYPIKEDEILENSMAVTSEIIGKELVKFHSIKVVPIYEVK